MNHGALIVEVVRGDALWALRSLLENPLEAVDLIEVVRRKAMAARH